MADMHLNNNNKTTHQLSLAACIFRLSIDLLPQHDAAHTLAAI